MLNEAIRSTELRNDEETAKEVERALEPVFGPVPDEAGPGTGPLKRLKVVIVKHDGDSQGPISGLESMLVDADTGRVIECVQDFSINMPMDGVITVDARLVVSEIEVVPSQSKGGE